MAWVWPQQVRGGEEEVCGGGCEGGQDAVATGERKVSSIERELTISIHSRTSK